MEKMGWRAGEGLGRNRQGMATPLMMQARALLLLLLLLPPPPPPLLLGWSPARCRLPRLALRHPFDATPSPTLHRRKQTCGRA